jgi:hypothetical protein
VGEPVKEGLMPERRCPELAVFDAARCFIEDKIRG